MFQALPLLLIFIIFNALLQHMRIGVRQTFRVVVLDPRQGPLVIAHRQQQFDYLTVLIAHRCLQRVPVGVEVATNKHLSNINMAAQNRVLQGRIFGKFCAGAHKQLNNLRVPFSHRPPKRRKVAFAQIAQRQQAGNFVNIEGL